MRAIESKPPYVVRLSRAWNMADAVFWIAMAASAGKGQAIVNLNGHVIIVLAMIRMIRCDTDITTQRTRRAAHDQARKARRLILELSLVDLMIPRTARPC